MITVVTWKWRAPWRFRSTYAPDTVHTLRAMVARHYPAPHRFVCITDDAAGLDGIDTLPIFRDWIDIPPPEGHNWPSCYVRLHAFAPEFGALIGADRYVSLDLDTVITGDLTPIFDRPEPFVIWDETDWPRTQFYNASIWLHTPGTYSDIYTRFDPRRSPRQAFLAGGRGGDQAWISYVLGPGHPVFSAAADGVISYRRHVQPGGGALPAGARVVNFHGVVDPWSPSAQALPWVKEHYGDASTWAPFVEPLTGRLVRPPRFAHEAHRR